MKTAPHFTPLQLITLTAPPEACQISETLCPNEQELSIAMLFPAEWIRFVLPRCLWAQKI